MCLEVCLKSCRGRENRCCCFCSTWVGMHLMGVMNYVVLICTALNMIRIFKIKFDIWLTFGLAIALLRCLFQLRLCCCCDSIQSRRQLMYVMNITTLFEALIFVAQLIVLIGNIHSG